MSDRIAQIIRLENEAKRPEHISSTVRWEMSRLYWEEFQSGTQQKEIAERVGKSRAHVCYMIKCWDICGRIMTGALPDFYDVYHSADVRGASADNDYGRGERGSGSRRKRQEPGDVHSTVQSILYHAAKLADDRAAWGELTDDERLWLRDAANSIRQAIGRKAA